jgi:hypothetical protein
MLQGNSVQAAELVGMVDAHPEIEAEIREKRLVKLKAALAGALPQY